MSISKNSLWVNQLVNLNTYRNVRKGKATRVQILDKAVCVSFGTNALEKSNKPFCSRRRVYHHVLANVMTCFIVVSEFERHSRHYVLFLTNTLGKGMGTFLSCHLISTTAGLLQGWLLYSITHEGWYAIKQRNQNHLFLTQATDK